jgi:pyruvate kinase
MPLRVNELTTSEKALTPSVLDVLASEVLALREELIASEAQVAYLLEAVHPANLPSARNLVDYLALRRNDIRDLQNRLARAGLSSLSGCEPHVLVTLDRILGLLNMARGVPVADTDSAPVGFREGEHILADNAERLLGRSPVNRAVRILVTLPEEAAEGPAFARGLISAGMDCARINCARGEPQEWSAMALNVRAAQREENRECIILVDLAGPKLRTAKIRGQRKQLRLAVGDRFELLNEGSRAQKDKSAPPRIGCTAPQVFDDANPGQPIWFDDGKIGGMIESSTPDGFLILVTHAKAKGQKLRPERSINLPETALTLPALGDKDLADLEAVAPWADAVEMSFVQREEDILSLHRALRDLGKEDLGVILKIEKQRAFDELPRLLLAAMRMRKCGVMIARGDLAVEAGFEQMAEVQEEILRISEAAHVPTIWATQVLENLAKEGMLSRAEVTDAAMSARAEAVMLNKGPFIVEAIQTLDDILGRMKEHQSKKRALYPPLKVSESLWSERGPAIVRESAARGVRAERDAR